MRIGYARVSTLDQNLDLQEDALKAAGCEKIYTDKAGGTRAERPGLERALVDLRAGPATSTTSRNGTLPCSIATRQTRSRASAERWGSRRRRSIAVWPSSDADDHSGAGGPIGQAVSTGSKRSAKCRCPANWTAYGLFLVLCGQVGYVASA